MLDNPDPNALEFIDFKLNLFADEIFVFTQKEKWKLYQQPATALDFTFEIHTKLEAMYWS